ncbi:hypothetical protein CRG98_010118 [Punica granatum]|uniref:Uncharacterized protein n=1 Tax=Punica granatum TaxID=22663 RepID=A0A2I0KLW5_PUNGR|nr:hypothetical protein CRG98_010118 [Punica granatum]
MGMSAKRLREVLLFVCSVEFWRMAVLWSIALITSYFQLLLQSLHIQKSYSYPRRSPETSAFRPVCIITGATSGLGAAAARALSKESFTIVLVGRTPDALSKNDGDKLHRGFLLDPAFIASSHQQPCAFKDCECYIVYASNWLTGKLWKSPDDGVRSIIDAALAPPEALGVYFFSGNGRTINSSPFSYNAKLASELWSASCDLFTELELAYKES